MRKNRLAEIVVMSAGMIFLLGACGHAAEQTETELLEPVSVNEYVSPVTYQMIGDTQILIGTAAPVAEEHCYHSNVTLTRIMVQPGDMVNAGDILAYADVAEAQETLDSLEQELVYENEVYELQCEISQEKQEDLSGTELSVEKENLDYDESLHAYRVSQLTKQIGNNKQIVEDAALTAKCDGQVTYIRDLSGGLEAGADENIVTISNPGHMQIEIKDTNIKQYAYRDYAQKYLLYSGKEIPVTEKEYSIETLVSAKANDSYPNVIFECPDEMDLTPGENCVVYFRKEQSDYKVPAVENSAIHMDEQGSCVYVEDADGKREKRIVQTGISDAHYTEIKSGVSEGEFVFCQSTEQLPASYTAYIADYSDYYVPNHGIHYERYHGIATAEISDCEGEITSIAVEEGKQVKAGDLLYVIDTGEGKAALAEAQNAIDSENASYEKQKKELQSDASETKLCELEMKLAETEHTYAIASLTAAYEKLKTGNDGTGKVSVYAKKDGTVEDIKVSEGDQVESGDVILEIYDGTSDLLQVQVVTSKTITVYPDDPAEPGERVEITTREKTYGGTCVAQVFDAQNTEKTDTFLVRMDDEICDDMSNGSSVDYPYIFMKNVIVLPGSMVYTETDPLNEKNVSHYVWKIVNEKLTKQYVMTDDRLKGAGTVILSGVEQGDMLAGE